jgi:hypothetical protein
MVVPTNFFLNCPFCSPNFSDVLEEAVVVGQRDAGHVLGKVLVAEFYLLGNYISQLFFFFFELKF